MKRYCGTEHRMFSRDEMKESLPYDPMKNRNKNSCFENNAMQIFTKFTYIALRK